MCTPSSSPNTCVCTASCCSPCVRPCNAQHRTPSRQLFAGLEDNIKLLKGSLCANPQLGASVTVFPLGLSSKNDTCFVVSGEGNVGDGFTKCGVQTAEEALAGFQQGYLLRGRMLVRRLDDLVQETVHVSKKAKPASLLACAASTV